ncbi:MAG: hypothetical protein JXB39_08985 [Deltaproteobacteria bacterium]|nr:hypothetical protein [Deltaproteobacteria bacterium]
MPSPESGRFHIASALEVLALGGLGLSVGLVAGFLALDAAAAFRGEPVGRGILMAAMLLAILCLPGLAAWTLGRRLSRERGNPEVLSPHARSALALASVVAGFSAAWFLGF